MQVADDNDQGDSLDVSDDGNGPVVRSLDVLPDTTIRAGEPPIKFDLPSRFGYLVETPTAFRATSNGVPGLNLTYDDTLRIAAWDAGIDTIVVQAWADNLLAVDTLVVTRQCYDFLFAGESSYFPHELGQSWEYSFRDWEEGYFGTITTEGVSTWTVTAVYNSCTQAEVVISDHITGEAVLESILSTISDSTWSVSRIVERRFKLVGDELDLGELNGPFDRLQPRVWRTQPQDTLSRLSYDEYFGFGTGGRGHVELGQVRES